MNDPYPGDPQTDFPVLNRNGVNREQLVHKHSELTTLNIKFFKYDKVHGNNSINNDNNNDNDNNETNEIIENKNNDDKDEVDRDSEEPSDKEYHLEHKKGQGGGGVDSKREDITTETNSAVLANKAQDSPTDLLPNMKSVKINRSKYKHYGHQSSMNAELLQKIMKESDQHEENKTSLANSKYDANSPKDSSMNSEIQKEWKSSSNKVIIDETMNNILGLPKNEIIWPYSSETLSELLRLKIEQEKTKQEEIKIEYASTTLKLLSLAKSMNIEHDTIPHLFNSSIMDLRKNIENLTSNHNELSNDPNSKKRGHSDHLKSETNSEINSELKAGKSETNFKNDTVKQAFENIHAGSSSEIQHHHGSSSSLVSPIRSPARLPPPGHKKGRSDDETIVGTGSGYQSPNYYSHQHSPNVLPNYPPGVYPMYYPPPPPPPPPHQNQTHSHSHNQYQNSPSKHGSNNTAAISPPANQINSLAAPITTNSNSNDSTSSSIPHTNTPSLCSPYQQKYHIMYGLPPGSQPFPPPPSFIPQQYYYVPNQNQPNNTNPSYSLMVPQHMYIPQDRDKEREKEKEKEDEPVHKKAKTNKNINFMISTPKNPPARKYNNPREK